jgi:C_GCAxxG_C_C family probable redox protein
MDQETIDRAARRARQLFETEYWCAESVLLAISEALGIESELIPRIATGFCSGEARTKGRCGSMTGAMMGINLASGRSEPGAPVEANYTLIRTFRDRFEKRFGSLDCYDLIGCDLGTVQGQQQFSESNRIQLCYRYAEEATRMALEVIEEGV